MNYFHGINDTEFFCSGYRLCTMGRLPSILAKTLTSGTGGSPVLPDMSEGKVIHLYLRSFSSASKESIVSTWWPFMC